MLRTTRHILKCKLQATDGKIGHVEDLYFDDQLWTLRYIVADTGDWLPGRQVLLAPTSIARLDSEPKLLELDLNKQQIEQSPSIQEHRPVSRQLQMQLADYFGWTPYWESPAAAPISWFPDRPQGDDTSTGDEPATSDPHLRSAEELLGYHIHARDGHIGHIEDFLLDEADWGLKYLVVDTRNWLPAKKVLVSMAWIDTVDWPAGEVAVNMPRSKIKNAPEFDPNVPVDKAYESALDDYYGQSVVDR